MRETRLRRGLTLESLAEKVGSTKAYMWQLENKKPAKPSADLLLKICDALGESPDFLIDDSIAEPDDKQLSEAIFRKVKSSNLSRSDVDKLIDIISRTEDKIETEEGS